MSGPRRHGLRLIAAIACFVLLALSFALLRESGASAHTSARAHAAAPPGRGLLGGVGGIVQGVGHTVNGVLNGVGGLLGAPTRPPHSGSPTPPTSAPPSTPPSSPASSAPHPPLRSTTPPRQPRQSGTGRPAPGVASPSHRTTHSASPVVVKSHRSDPASTSAAPTSNVPVALGSPDPGIPGLDVTAALAAVTVAMVLGVGLIVYRAGYREERAH